MGKVVGVHGLRGAIKVRSFAESPLDVFRPDCPILLTGPEGEKTCHVQWVKVHHRLLLMSLDGTTDRNQAESLAGAEIYVPMADLPDLEEGTYYWTDLIGISVFTADDMPIGRIEAIIPTGSNDVYVVKNEADEILIPALEGVILAVDIENKTMRVKLPEGL